MTLDRPLLGVLHSLGTDIRLIHPSRSAEDPSGGGDFDCAVSGLDGLWPLRLPTGWRLCQCLHYDSTGWYWVIDRDGEVLALDTLDDPRGIGRYGFPTLFNSLEPGFELKPAARAGYLTAKRLRKGSRSSADWKRIAALVQEDPSAYLRILQSLLGRRTGRSVFEGAVRGSEPASAVWLNARWAQQLRRMRTPARAFRIAVLQMLRVSERLRWGTGLQILLVGPDGSGKSTLAEALPEACEGLFRRDTLVHWRPGVLPRPGRVVGRQEGDQSEPHARPPHGRALSTALLFYFWADFLLGAWVRLWPVRVRTGLIVIERGWWDIAVDPARYRLRVPRQLVLLLGSVLPRPDLVLLLAAEPDVLLARKKELPGPELARQTGDWERIFRKSSRARRIDAAQRPEQVARAARELIVEFLESRAVARLGHGWVALPTRRSSRWIVPRGPRRMARPALSIYQPVTVRGRIGWEAARVLASFGALRLLGRGDAPSRFVREALGPHLPPRGNLAIGRGNANGRYLALILREDGSSHGVAKVAVDDEGRAALAREAAALETIAPHLPRPLVAPRLLAHDDGVLLVEAISWRPRIRPWRIPPEVGYALGAFFRRGAATPNGQPRGLGHGDFAPWNLLQTSEGWALVDWESATTEAEPFFDLFHYVAQGHALLGRPSYQGILAGLRGSGWVGSAIAAYADGAGFRASEARNFLVSYLESSSGSGTSGRKDARAGRAAREKLLIALGGEGS